MNPDKDVLCTLCGHPVTISLMDSTVNAMEWCEDCLSERTREARVAGRTPTEFFQSVPHFVQRYMIDKMVDCGMPLKTVGEDARERLTGSSDGVGFQSGGTEQKTNVNPRKPKHPASDFIKKHF